MPAPNTTIWLADEHTLAKHVILRHYLAAWFPILSTSSDRILYYDGFAGPGRYQRGEEGSPLIALNVARTHTAKLASELVFVFVEEDAARAAHLDAEIHALTLPTRFKALVFNEKFETVLGSMLDRLEREGHGLAPTFAFIDPFGITGLPFELIARLMKQRQCEVLITFMSHAIERWVTKLPTQTDALIGIPGAAQQIAAAPDRIAAARALYEQSLRGVAKFVRFFEMRNTKNRTIYDLFFASNNALGHYKMKEAMWKTDLQGDYRFADGASRAPTLFGPTPENDLAPLLATHFQGQTALWHDVEAYTHDQTPYLDKHAKAALKLLEADGGFQGHRIEVASEKVGGAKRRKNTYPAGTRITFPPKA